MARKSRRTILLKDYEPWMIEALRHHTEQGFSVRSFPAKYKICLPSFDIWIRDIPELRAINIDYKRNVKKKTSFYRKIIEGSVS